MSLHTCQGPDLLHSALHDLDAVGVKWVLLRGAAELATLPLPGDVDLLIAPSQLPVATAALRQTGFLPVQALGHGSHRFFSGWDDDLRSWVRLDLVTELRFGEVATAPAGLTEAVLARSSWLPGERLRVPDVADAFWLLLLHCALDKKIADRLPEDRIRPGRWRELARLAPRATATGPVASYAQPLLPAPLVEVLDAARAGQQHVLVSQLVAADRANRATRPSQGFRRLLTRTGQRAGGRVPGHGRVVVVLGPDGSGKSTLTQRLAEDVPLPTDRVYFGIPRLTSAVARAISRLPLGYFVLQLLQTLLRSARVELARGLGRVVLLDRHPIDSLTAPDRHQLTLREAVKRCVIRALAPTPDVFLVLDAPAETMFARKGEHHVAALEAARQRYLELALSYPAGRVIDANQIPGAVLEDAHRLLWETLSTGGGRR